MNVKIYTLKFFGIAVLSLIAMAHSSAQTHAVGDYESKAGNTASWSWNTAANWEVWNGTGWSNASTPPNNTSVVVTLQATTASPTNTVVTGNIAVTNTGTLVINSGVSLNVGAVNYVLSNVTLNGGTLKAPSSKTLVIKGDFTIDATNGGVFLGNGGTVDFQGTTTVSGGTASVSTNSFGFSNVTITNTLHLGTSYFKVNGLNFTNNGTFDCGNSTVEFNSQSSDQNINNSSTTIFNDIYINNSGFTVYNNGADTQLKGLLSFASLAGSFSADAGGTGGVFTVLSSSLVDQARIGTLPSTSSFTGIATIQRFIDGKTGGDYRYVSMPLIDGTVSLWQNAMGVTGNYTNPSTHAQFSTITDAGNKNPSAFYYNNATQAYVALGSGGSTTTTSVDNTLGYAVYNFSEANAVVNYTGTIASGDIDLPISSTANAFNLTANPYPSPVEWETILDDNPTAVQGSIWWRTGNHQYNRTYVGSLTLPPGEPGTGTIAIGQSYWTQSMGGASVLHMHETQKSLVDATFTRKASAGNYVIFAMSSATQKDYAAIRFVSGATDDHDRAWDASKRLNGDYSKSLGRNTYINLSTYTSSPTSDYAINSVAEINGCSKTFGVKVADVAVGDYSFSFDDLSTMQLPYSLVLVDHFLGTEKTITQGTTYNFSVTADAGSFGTSRFELRFNTVVPTPVISAQGLVLNSSVQSGNQWYKDGQAIAGATNATYDVTSSGVYSVKTTTGGCTTTSDNLTMTINGVSEVHGLSIIYPNPTQGLVMINLPQELDASLTGINVYDSQGRTMISSDNDASLLNRGAKSIDLTNFKSGVYILNIICGSQVKSIRLIKK